MDSKSLVGEWFRGTFQDEYVWRCYCELDTRLIATEEGDPRVSYYTVRFVACPTNDLNKAEFRSQSSYSERDVDMMLMDSYDLKHIEFCRMFNGFVKRHTEESMK